MQQTEKPTLFLNKKAVTTTTIERVLTANQHARLRRKKRIAFAKHKARASATITTAAISKRVRRSARRNIKHGKQDQAAAKQILKDIVRDGRANKSLAASLPPTERRQLVLHDIDGTKTGSEQLDEILESISTICKRKHDIVVHNTRAEQNFALAKQKQSRFDFIKNRSQ